MENKQNKNPVLVITRRELKSFFASPAPYIIYALFLFCSGVLFFSTFFIRNRTELRMFFNLLPILLTFFVPALTMRLYSEEKKSGSIETLMTLPVTEVQVVNGKYLASFFISAIMIAPTLLYAVSAALFGHLDSGPIIGGYIGAFLLCGAYSAIGLFASSVTKNQIIAIFTALAINLVLTLSGSFLLFMPPKVVSVVSFFSISAHFDSISKGIVDSRDIIYFASVITLFILATIQSERNSK